VELIRPIRNPEKPTSPPASQSGGFFLGLRRAGLSQAPHSSSAWFHDAVPVHDATSIARHARPTAESETVLIAWPTVSSTLSQPSSISWMSPTPLAGSLIAERTKEGMNAAKRRGKHVGRPLPCPESRSHSPGRHWRLGMKHFQAWPA
jgi:hypothetical protein